MGIKSVLSNPAAYHHIRNVVTGGLPLRKWAELGGLFNGNERIADLGCGPADILRVLTPKRRPEFYLGVDLSQMYLDAAERRARAQGVHAEFHRMDLQRIPSDESVRQELRDLLKRHRITRVLLFGVIHHIDDSSAITTLDLVHDCATVRSMVTQDVIRMPGQWVNNRFCDMDRGEFIRHEAEYDSLMARTRWPKREKVWTTPKISFIKYIHYVLRKNAAPE